MIDIASTKIIYPDKGEDDYLVRAIDNTKNMQLLAVADGLSLNDGKAAANWVINFLGCINNLDNPHHIFQVLKQGLEQIRHQYEESQTTLTCGILQQIGDDDNGYLRFEYFAIGDSPIWKIVIGDPKYPYQRFLVHGAPYPAETARVYSTISLRNGCIKGPVTFGAIEIMRNEVLIVCTDGIPEREIFVRDIGKKYLGGDLSLCEWLFQKLPYDNNKFDSVLKTYFDRGVLYDDATIIVARMRPSSPGISDKDGQKSSPHEINLHNTFQGDYLDSGDKSGDTTTYFSNKSKLTTTQESISSSDTKSGVQGKIQSNKDTSSQDVMAALPRIKNQNSNLVTHASKKSYKKTHENLKKIVNSIMSPPKCEKEKFIKKTISLLIHAKKQIGQNSPKVRKN